MNFEIGNSSWSVVEYETIQYLKTVGVDEIVQHLVKSNVVSETMQYLKSVVVEEIV